MSIEISPFHFRIDIPVHWTKMGPIAAKTTGIQVDVTGEGASKPSTGPCTEPDARASAVEADMVTVAR